jgi:ribosomal protein S18 acetylase RimI-like enzyme
MAEIVIREAIEDDAEAIHAMVVALAHHVGKPEYVTSTPDAIRRHGFGADRAFETLIAEQGGKPVGLILYFCEFSTWRGRRGVYVQDLYVAKEARALGLGKRLIAACVKGAAKRGAGYMRLSVERVNEGAAAFYERLGFEERLSERMFVLADEAFAAVAAEKSSK